MNIHNYNMKIFPSNLNSNGYWDKPIIDPYTPSVYDLALFDQNGYDLTKLEQEYGIINQQPATEHRHKYRMSIKQPWFVQDFKIEGAVLNHSLLFERKGYTGAALEQLTKWSDDLPLVHKVIAMRPKWGLDFSMDYVDRLGNSFEILHWEYDGFSYEEIISVKTTVESILSNIDFDQAGLDLLRRKDEWHGLDFFAQSDWKCNYFGIPKERFKLVIWK